jgi:hypothetical protein
MVQINIRELLKSENPERNPMQLNILADALETYKETQDNIAKNGAVCAHPRTGAPIENPYIKIRSTQAAIIQKFRAVKSEKTLQAMADNA